MFTFFGCVITNYYAFQLFINYPLSYEQVAITYHDALKKDMEVWDLMEKQGLNFPYESQATKLSYATFPEILWVKRDDFPKEMCDKLQELEKLPDPRFRYHEQHTFRGCLIPRLPLHKEVCRYINYFNPGELICELLAGRVKQEMNNLDNPSRKTTFDYPAPCDCAKWDCAKWEEKQEPPNRPYDWYGRNSGVWKVRSPDTLTQDKKEPPKVACMAIGCQGSEPK